MRLLFRRIEPCSCARSAFPAQRSALIEGLYRLAGRAGSRSEEKRWSTTSVVRRPIGRQILRNVISHDDTHEADERIHPDSLDQTLEAHHKYNHTSPIIYKVKTDSAVDKDEKVSLESVKNEGHKTKSKVVNKHEKSKGWQLHDGVKQELSMKWAVEHDVPRYVQLPWVQELDQKNESGRSSLQRLTAEIEAVDSYFTPTPAELESAQVAITQLKRTLLESSSRIARVDVIGSRATSLGYPSSDIDLNLVLKGGMSQTDPVESFEVLRVAHKHLRAVRFFPNSQDSLKVTYFARGARVPIISGLHVPSGLEFQIQSTIGVYGSLEFTRGLMAEFPTLKPLYKTIKQLLDMRALTRGSFGGLTSYPLLNMIAATLKLGEAHLDPHNAGKHLLHFLAFYNTIDFSKTGITWLPTNHDLRQFKQQRHSGGRKADLESESGSLSEIHAMTDLVAQDPVGAMPHLFKVAARTGREYKMTLSDPANLINDLGKTATRINHVQATFCYALRGLQYYMHRWDQHVEDGEASPSEAQRPRPLLQHVLSGDYSFYELDRQRLAGR